LSADPVVVDVPRFVVDPHDYNATADAYVQHADALAPYHRARAASGGSRFYSSIFVFNAPGTPDAEMPLVSWEVMQVDPP
jgi:hypothetical protein